MNGYYDGEEYWVWHESARRQSGRGARSRMRYYEEAFTCRHCGALVQANPLLSGVQHRNHCPYCLWSLHVDLYEAGDRLCACRGGMRPIGLTFKAGRNKYAAEQGELMLVHQCELCCDLSINRIAADDDDTLILEIYRHSLSLPYAEILDIKNQGIGLLGKPDEEWVKRRLYGGMLLN